MERDEAQAAVDAARILIDFALDHPDAWITPAARTADLDAIRRVEGIAFDALDALG